MTAWTIQTRSELIAALSDAAEIEHSLACQYLFTGFSLRRSADGTIDATQAETTRSWASTLFLIARQEMEHLGIAFNLLTAIGAAPSWRRPGFPQPSTYLPENVPLELRPFSTIAVQQFLCLERPDGVQLSWCNSPTGPAAPTLQDLYESIRAAFVALAPGGNLFIGPPDAQVDGDTLVDENTRFYSVELPAITDLPSALAAIDQVVSEGEGGQGAPGQESHFARLMAISYEYDAMGGDAFPAARPIIINPTTGDRPGEAGGTLITHPVTIEAARVFNKAYNTMLLALVRFYAHTDETDEELTALSQVAFFPLMTMVIRPLGEMLTMMPAFASQGNVEPPERAGPCFEIDGSADFLPHKIPAWTLLQEMLFEVRDDLATLIPLVPEPDRMAYLHTNVSRICQNFSDTLSGMLPPLTTGASNA